MPEREAALAIDDTKRTSRPGRPKAPSLNGAATGSKAKTGQNDKKNKAAKKDKSGSKAKTGQKDKKTKAAKKEVVRKTRYAEHPGVFVKRSSIHGTGLFADDDFSEGDRMVEYLGEKITKKESDRRYESQEKRGKVYIFDLNQKRDLDGNIKRNPAKYANHSCHPNAESDIIKGHIYIIAKKRIRPGDEIVYDYNFPYDDWWERPCLCGGPKCRGFIIGGDASRKLKLRKKRFGSLAAVRKHDEAENEEED